MERRYADSMGTKQEETLPHLMTQQPAVTKRKSAL